MPNGLTYTRMGWTLNKRNVIYCRHEKKKICTYKKTKVNINNWYKYKFVVVILCADVFSVGLAFSLPHRRQRVVICYNRIWFVGWMRNIEGRARLAGDDNIWIHSTSPFFTLSLSLCEAFFCQEFIPFFFVSQNKTYAKLHVHTLTEDCRRNRLYYERCKKRDSKWWNRY